MFSNYKPKTNKKKKKGKKKKVQVKPLRINRRVVSLLLRVVHLLLRVHRVVSHTTRPAGHHNLLFRLLTLRRGSVAGVVGVLSLIWIEEKSESGKKRTACLWKSSKPSP